MHHTNKEGVLIFDNYGFENLHFVPKDINIHVYTLDKKCTENFCFSLNFTPIMIKFNGEEWTAEKLDYWDLKHIVEFTAKDLKLPKPEIQTFGSFEKIKPPDDLHCWEFLHARYRICSNRYSFPIYAVKTKLYHVKRLFRTLETIGTESKFWCKNHHKFPRVNYYGWQHYEASLWMLQKQNILSTRTYHTPLKRDIDELAKKLKIRARNRIKNT